MTVAVADSADANRYNRANRVGDVVRSFRRGELVVANGATVIVVVIGRRGGFSLAPDPRAAIALAIERARRSAAREELVEAYEEPPPDHLVLGVAIASEVDGGLQLISPTAGASSSLANATGTAVATLGLGGLVSGSIAGYAAVELADDVRDLVTEALAYSLPSQPLYYPAAYYARPAKFYPTAGEVELEIAAAIDEANEWLAVV